MRTVILLFLACTTPACVRSRDPYEAYQIRRIAVAAENIVNADTVADAQFRNVPYRRKVVEWDAAAGRAVVREDDSPFPRVWNPGHALASPEGWLLRPNVDVYEEMIEIWEAERALGARGDEMPG